MVFRGKASTACEPCRNLRTKCDRKQPECSQCLRTGKKCFGYRDPLEMTFQDETSRIISGAQRRAASSGRHSRRSKTRSPSTAASRSRQRKSATPIEVLGLVTSSHLQGAVGHFMSVYRQGHHVDWAKALYARPDCTDAFTLSLEACSILCLSIKAGVSNQAGLLDSARSSYTKALRSVNASLSLPGLASRDDAAASVMLLALYEALSISGNCSCENSQANWTRHVNGALAVLSTRDQSTLESRVSKSLTGHIVSCVVIDSLQRRRSIPSSLQRLYSSCRHVSEYQYAFWSATEELASLVDITSTDTGHDAHTLDPCEKIERAQNIDARFVALTQSLTAAFDTFNASLISESQDAQPEPPYRLMRGEVTLQLLRIVTNEMIVSQSQLYLESLTAAEDQNDMLYLEILTKQTEAYSTGDEVISSICDTVSDALSEQRISSPRTTTEAKEQAETWAKSLLLPLSVAFESAMCSSRKKNEITGLLARLQSEFRIEMAGSIAVELRQAKKVGGGVCGLFLF